MDLNGTQKHFCKDKIHKMKVTWNLLGMTKVSNNFMKSLHSKEVPNPRIYNSSTNRSPSHFVPPSFESKMQNTT